MDNIVLIAAMMGTIIGALGYLYSKGANGLFLLALCMIGYGSVLQMKATGEIHELSTGVGESPLTELGRKLGWSLEIFERLASHLQIAIFVFIGTFFIARTISWIASSKAPVKKEGQNKRRKRVLKSFGMKNMTDLRSRY